MGRKDQNGWGPGKGVVGSSLQFKNEQALQLSAGACIDQGASRQGEGTST